VFRKRGEAQTDVVVLGCTHYPLLEDEIRAVAPWPVTLIDPAPAIARRTADVIEETRLHGADDTVPAHGTVLLTAAIGATDDTGRAYATMGFPVLKVLDIPV
jgi:glutamate racemase